MDMENDGEAERNFHGDSGEQYKDMKDDDMPKMDMENDGEVERNFHGDSSEQYQDLNDDDMTKMDMENDGEAERNFHGDSGEQYQDLDDDEMYENDAYENGGEAEMDLHGDSCEQYEYLSEHDAPHEVLRMIIRSVEKSERHKKHKRKRSSLTRNETNGSEADNEMKAYSRCSISYFCKVLKKIRSCPRYVELVKWMGFAETLNLEDCLVPRSFVQWVANNVSADEEIITIGTKQIQLSPQSVTESLGTPTGDLPVDTDEENGKAAFLACFGLYEVPSIKFFGKMILARDILHDAVFCRCFMAVALGTFFCPNSNTKLSTKYMGALVVVAKIKDRNWSKFIHEWMIVYIRKFLKEPIHARQLTLTLGGCIYHLAARCLDFIDFSPIEIPATLPRIKVWKGNLIKVFSDMYIGTNGKYGAYPVKDISETCYSKDNSKCKENICSEEFLRNSISTAIDGLVGNKLKDSISETFVQIMKDEETNFCVKAQQLVMRVVQAFVANHPSSQDTAKRPSLQDTGMMRNSQEDSYRTANESQNTEKIQTDESQTTQKLQSDGSQATEKLQSDGSQATEKLPSDGSQATEKLPSDGTQATEKLPSDGSQATEKLPSDGSQATEKLQTDESQSTTRLPNAQGDFYEDDNDEDALIQRKRRRTISNQSTQAETSRRNGSLPCCPELIYKPVPTEEDPGEQTETLCSQNVQSASLQHMLPDNNIEEKDICSPDTTSKQKNLNSEHVQSIKDAMDLNKTMVESDKEEFSVLNERPAEQVTMETSQQIPAANLSQQERRRAQMKDIDVNLPNIQIIAEHYARTHLKPRTQPANIGEYLEIARKKYTWIEDSPAFRIMEDQDDLGNTIEEPELIRPFDMDADTYNQQVEAHILRYKNTIGSNLDNQEILNTPAPANISKQRDLTSNRTDTTEHEVSVQCAQREPSVTGLTNTPIFVHKPSVCIDLVSPEALNTSQDHVNLETTSTSSGRTSGYRKALIQGKRLFDGSDDEYSYSSKKNTTPVRELLNNIGHQSPPEIEILGEKRTVTNNNNMMMQETDDYYNTSLSLASSSSTYGKENYLPQRIPKKSYAYCSPFDVNPSPSVAVDPFHKKVWQILTRLCDDPEHKLSWIICIDRVRVTMFQLGGSMKTDGHVDAWVINAFCRKLFRDNHPSKSKKHFFFNTVSDFFLEKFKNQEAIDYWHKKALESFVGANKAAALHLSDGLYFPTVSSEHWFVFLVNIKYQNFIFLDSFFGKDSSYHKKVDDLLIKNFKKTWNEAGLKKINFETFGRAYPNVPKQKTGNDCGIFVMKYLELFLARQQGQCTFSHLDIPAFRVRYAHDILMTDHNSVHDSKILVAGLTKSEA